MNKQCAKCGAANHGDAELCSLCGERLGERQKAEGRRVPTKKLSWPVGGWRKVRRDVAEKRLDKRRKWTERHERAVEKAIGALWLAPRVLSWMGFAGMMIATLVLLQTNFEVDFFWEAAGVWVGLVLLGAIMQALGGIWGALERISRLNVETSKRQNGETGNDKRQTAGPQITPISQIGAQQESA